ncbi:Pheromone receptor Rcb3 B43 [Mycena venus]|uniref:Pheromone receptor Rcb3 B43 n=1 Tax=Mycena venus TaxID=2733690 RepID=A0A8H7CQS8_9AGAR|nr:Pheromone receptor Rcb3 B43 [Mycena venus]
MVETAGAISAALIAAFERLRPAKADKRHAVLVDLAIGLAISFVHIPIRVCLGFRHRYDLLEKAGWYPTTYNVVSACPVRYLGPNITLICTCYVVLTLRPLPPMRHIAQFVSSNSGLTAMRYFRLVAVTSLELSSTSPYTSPPRAHPLLHKPNPFSGAKSLLNSFPFTPVKPRPDSLFTDCGTNTDTHSNMSCPPHLRVPLSHCHRTTVHMTSRRAYVAYPSWSSSSYPETETEPATEGHAIQAPCIRMPTMHNARARRRGRSCASLDPMPMSRRLDGGFLYSLPSLLSLFHYHFCISSLTPAYIRKNQTAMSSQHFYGLYGLYSLYGVYGCLCGSP